MSGIPVLLGSAMTLIVPDNLKAEILKNAADEFVVNDRYRRILEHYCMVTVR